LDYCSFEWRTRHLNDATRFKLIDILNGFPHLRTHTQQNGKQCRSCIV
jgi:hypothetical protein